MSIEKDTGGRPRTFEESEVLDSAMRVFWDKGFRRATTRDIEAATGLGPSSIANAFGSKKSLLETAMKHYEARAADRLVVPLESAVGGIDAIQTFFSDLVDWVTQDEHRGCLIINMMAENDESMVVVAERAQTYRDRVRAALRSGLQRAATLGEVDENSLEERVHLLFGMVLGINIAARGGAPRDEVDAMHHAVRAQLEHWRSA